LVKINAATGVGTAVNPAAHMTFDVRVTGLAYDPVADTLYGITSGFATRNSELVTINRTSGAETLVGGTLQAFNAHESLVLDTSVNPSKLLSGGTTLYEINKTTGVASVVGGSYPRKMFGLGAEVPPPPPPDADMDGIEDAQDNCPQDANPGQEDNEPDGIGDVCDPDDDNDGTDDGQDAFPFDDSEDTDTDGDMLGNNADLDDDNDTIADDFELANMLDPLDAADAGADPDMDGFTNLEEFEGGSDPQDPDSTPETDTLDWLPLLLEDD